MQKFNFRIPLIRGLPMQMIQCPNCGKLTGFKRALGFGTFFMVVITGGLWLLAILFYPLRCITCGLTSSDARGSRGALAFVFILILAAMFGIFTHTGKRSDSAAAYIDNSPSISEARNDVPAPASHIYTVAQISAHMNNIPTGTDLTARGFYLSPHVSGGWAPPNQMDPCSVLLYGGTVRTQHGEADPRDYCRFSVVLQDENTNQIHYLVCNMSLEEAQVAKRQCHYKSSLLAHGTYASSLDFHIMPAFMGQQIGVPALDDCTLEPLSEPPAPQESQAPPTSSQSPQETEAPPTPDKIMRAMNEVDSLPENRNKPYPVDGEVELDVRKALSTSKALRSATITLVSLHREVTLSGTVVDESSRELADDIASHVPGVVAVHNNLTVGGGAKPQ